MGSWAPKLGIEALSCEKTIGYTQPAPPSAAQISGSAPGHLVPWASQTARPLAYFFALL